MLRSYMLHPRDWVCDAKLDSAETLQVRGGKCVGAVGEVPVAALNSHFLYAISPSMTDIANRGVGRRSVGIVLSWACTVNCLVLSNGFRIGYGSVPQAARWSA